jgi:hypothetical protein
MRGKLIRAPVACGSSDRDRQWGNPPKEEVQKDARLRAPITRERRLRPDNHPWRGTERERERETLHPDPALIAFVIPYPQASLRKSGAWPPSANGTVSGYCRARHRTSPRRGGGGAAARGVERERDRRGGASGGRERAKMDE